MGAVAKVGFEFDTDVFGGLTTTTILSPLPPAGSDKFAAMFAKFYGQNMCYVLLGGPWCREIEMQGEEAVVEFAREVVAGTLGPDALPHITRSAHHSWLNDPWALGAWSNAEPGHVSARVQLQQPIDQKVFFAGEAVSLQGNASMGGAFLTGQQAVAGYLAG